VRVGRARMEGLEVLLVEELGRGGSWEENAIEGG
jgi:hypothetical protein